jgi:hypothetical protein
MAKVGWTPYDHNNQHANPLPAVHELVWIWEDFYEHGPIPGWGFRYGSGHWTWRRFDGSDDIGVRGWCPIEQPPNWRP